MTPAESAGLLTVAAAFDNRKPDEDQARAWALALDGLRFIDCREAIVNHYRGSREWMMPVDVIRAVKKLRAARLAAYGTPEPPAHIDPDDTAALHAWQLRMRADIADGTVTRETHPVAELEPMPRRAAEDRVKAIRAQFARRAPEPEEEAG